MEITIAQIVGLTLKVCILAIVFALGLKANWADVVSLLRRPALLARSLFAMYVLTPLIAVLLVLVFPAPRALEVAILLMAISAGAPVLPQKLLKLAAHPPYVYSLSVIAALLAIVTVPLSLALLGALADRAVGVPPGQVAYTIATQFLAPLIAGMISRQVWPALAARIVDPILSMANVILLGLVLLLVATNFSAILGIGVSGLAVIVAMTCAALATGHALGGPDPNDRTALALACATRYPALLILIASLNFPDAKPLPVVVAYLLISNLAATPYILWRKSQRGAELAGQSRAKTAQ